MKMRWFTVMASAVVMSMAYTSCSKDEDSIALRAEREQNGALRARDRGERGGLAGNQIVINFSDFAPSMMAGPTSYGENYYSKSGSSQVKMIKDSKGIFTSEVNKNGNVVEFWNGGIALSHWNYQSNPSDDASLPKDWWYSYKNQMSVYNTKSSGKNFGAGHGDDNFGVVFGYVDDYNKKFGVQKPSFYFDKPRKLVGLWICNSSYTYGVIKHGNKFGKYGEATSLEKAQGYFQVILECWDTNGTRVARRTRMLADYSTATKVDMDSTWSYWPINAEGVKTVTFNFEGSDAGDYGLNTPAYLCIDDITLE